jgi:hypothetical protein
MERHFNQDFSRVRYGCEGGGVGRAVNALAYTVGRCGVWGGQYIPGTTAGRKLMVHELRMFQQSSTGQLRKAADETPVIFEQRRMPQRAVAGVRCLHRCSILQFSVSPRSDAEKKPPEKKEAGEVVVEGLKTVAEQATDNNARVKKVIIEPLKDRLKGKWNRLGAGEKAATTGLGAATLGMAGGALLSDPSGRKQLEGVNLATPFTLVPYMPLSSFKYTLPSGDSPDKRLFKFETGFKADDLINLRTESRGLPKMSLTVNMQWGYDPASERLTILGGDASLGLVPGLSLSAGAYKDVLRPPQTSIGPEGQMTQIKKSVPEFDKPQPIPDVRIMLNVDLMKFKPGDLVRQIKGMF